MPITHFTEKFFNIKAEYIKNYSINESKKEYILDIQLPVSIHTCPCCQKPTTQIKDYRLRTVRLSIQHNYTIIANYNHRRYICQHCGKSFSESNPFVKRYQQLSTLFKHHVMESFGDVVSYTSIARRFNISVTTVIRYFDKMNIPKPSELPCVLSIDEFKGNAAGQKYQVILTDPQSGTVLDILPKRDTKAIERYFMSFNRQKRRAVTFIVMDMSAQFRSIMERVFPWAHIVCDRYHVVRLVNWALENVRKREQKTLANYSKTLKQNKRILLKHPKKLRDDEKIKLSEILRVSPDLYKAYVLKLRFGWIKTSYGKDNIDNCISYWLQLVKASKLDEFSNLLTSFNTWRIPVINAFLLPFSNAFTEGCNNKIKVLKRISYGLRNFKRFRVRILILGAKNGTSCKHATDANKCA